jgi:hypothetical protein
MELSARTLLTVNADDFFMAANLDKPRDSKVGSNVTLVNVMKICGLNTRHLIGSHRLRTFRPKPTALTHGSPRSMRNPGSLGVRSREYELRNKDWL